MGRASAIRRAHRAGRQSERGTGPTCDAVSAHCHAHQAEEQVCYEEVVLTVRGEPPRHWTGSWRRC